MPAKLYFSSTGAGTQDASCHVNWLPSPSGRMPSVVSVPNTELANHETLPTLQLQSRKNYFLEVYMYMMYSQDFKISLSI